MTGVGAAARQALILGAALALASCGDGAATGDEPSGGGASSQNEALLKIDDGDEGLLGSVDLPAPDWVPDGLPLPGDAHIFLATHIPRDGEPDLYMLQVRSFVEPESYARAVYGWARNKGLSPELDDRPGQKTRLVTFTSAGDTPAMVQVLPKDAGYRDIVISFAGPL